MTTVLVIEDMDELREEIMELLSYEGFEAVGAANGVKGVEVAKKVQPDLILCDIAMPEMDGYQTLITLRSHPPTANTPFIFLTAKASKADMRQGMELGADDYITKPFTATELVNAINARLKKQDSLVRQMHQADQLAQIPTLLAFHDQLHQAIAEYGQFALLFLDIDHFNLINNTLGYTIGDLLFQAVGARLQQSTPDPIARLKGDEFALIMPQIATLEAADHWGRQISQGLREPFRIYEQEIFLTASVGIALYPRHGDDVESLIKSANLAMYAAKQRGGNTHFTFSPDLSARSSEYLALANNLLRAVEKQEFCVYYQPILSAQTLAVVAVEALVRWQHPQLGLISPRKFIATAEELGVIKELGEVVLTRTLADLRQMEYRVAVNLSVRQLGKNFGLGEFIANLLASTQFKGDRLELEITESTFISEREEVKQILSHLRQLGAQIAIDDFGTGYSSLSYLQSLPIDSLKIDPCFIQNLEHNSHDQVLVQTMINLAHALGLYVTAEGVETQAQLELLQKYGCDRLQGYLFTPPLPIAKFREFCDAQSAQLD